MVLNKDAPWCIAEVAWSRAPGWDWVPAQHYIPDKMGQAGRGLGALDRGRAAKGRSPKVRTPALGRYVALFISLKVRAALISPTVGKLFSGTLLESGYLVARTTLYGRYLGHKLAVSEARSRISVAVMFVLLRGDRQCCSCHAQDHHPHQCRHQQHRHPFPQHLFSPFPESGLGEAPPCVVQRYHCTSIGY